MEVKNQCLRPQVGEREGEKSAWRNSLFVRTTGMTGSTGAQGGEARGS